jgi:hypothetical protein
MDGDLRRNFLSGWQVRKPIAEDGLLVAPAKQKLYSTGRRGLQPKRLDPAKRRVSFLLPRPMDAGRRRMEKSPVESRDSSLLQAGASVRSRCTGETKEWFVISGLHLKRL